MGIFEKIFGKKEEKTKTVNLKELKSVLEERQKDSSKSLLEQAKKKFPEISRLLNDLKFELNSLKEINLEKEGPNTYLRKIVETSKKGFLSRTNALAERLSPPKPENFQAVKAYSLSSLSIFRKEFSDFQKLISYTGILAKEQMKNISKIVSELDSVFSELEQSAKGNVSKGLNELNLLVSEIEEAEKEAREKERQKSAALKEEKEAEEEIKTREQKVSELEKGEEYSGIKSALEEKKGLEEKKDELRQKISSLISLVEKPLKKLQNLCENNQYFLEKDEKRLLNTYLSNPVLAAKQDPKAESLKKILSEAEKLIKDKKISFKNKKEENKRLESINYLKEFDFFSEFFWKMNEIETKLSEKEKKIHSSEIFKKQSILKQKAESSKKLLLQKKELLSSIEKKLKEKRKKLEELKKSLKEAVYKEFQNSLELKI